MYHRILSTSILTLLLVFPASAQMLGVNMALYQAYGDFNRNIDRDPSGLAINYVHGLGEESRFAVGIELGVAMYANKTYQLAVPGNDPVDMYEEDCFWTIHGLGQAMLYKSPSFQLYGEGRIGVTTFFSEQHVMEDVDDEFEDLDSFKTYGTAFNLGIGGGLRYNLSGLFGGDPRVYDRLWLNTAATLCSGTRADYRNAGEGVISLEESGYRSLTNYLGLRFGLSYSFVD